MLHLIIDGYNYINRIQAPRISGPYHLELVRKDFLEKLALYKRKKQTHITVVFDAYRGNSLNRQWETYKGITIIYSKMHETADEIIIERIHERKAGTVVVSSDRAIIDEAKRCGIPFITPIKLNEAMKYAEENKGETKPMLKGNPKKLPKKLRKSLRAVEKI